MSKQIRPRALALALASALISVALSTAPRAGAQQQGAASVAPTNTKTAAVVAATAEVLRETSEVRELPILRPVKSGAQSRAEIERMIIKNMNEETTPADLRASELALKKLGLVPPQFEFRPFLIKLLTEQVAGYYDPKAQEFYLADWIDVDGQKPVMAHELTHALQDQHFNLRRFEKWPKGDSDAELAAHALIEGDATLVMIRYITRDLQRAVAFAKSLGATESQSEQIEKAPRALRESLLFPYERGAKWATTIYRRGGWSLLTKAYTELPASTEQILHPEKYLAREAPVKVEMPDVRGLLGNGWKRIDYDVNGEWGYYLILNEYVQKLSEAGAAGWAGDRYSVYEDEKTGSILIAQLSVWDTEKDASEFLDAYARRAVARYSDASEIEGSPRAEGQARSFRTPSDGRILMELRGTRVLVLEGVPEKTDATALFKKIWSEQKTGLMVRN